MARKSKAAQAAEEIPVAEVIEESPATPSGDPDIFDQQIAARQAEAAAQQQAAPEGQTLQEAMAATSAAPSPEQQTEPTADPSANGEKKWVDRGTFGHHNIDLGDGRRLRLIRDRQFAQEAIKFEPKSDDVDPRPSPEDVEFMKKEHGMRYDGKERVWIKQLARNTDEDRFARANSDKEIHNAFVELGNRIRARNGKEPVDYSFGQEQSR